MNNNPIHSRQCNITAEKNGLWNFSLLKQGKTQNSFKLTLLNNHENSIRAFRPYLENKINLDSKIQLHDSVKATPKSIV